MTEVYWVAGTNLLPSGGDQSSGVERFLEHPMLAAVLKKTAARMDWVDQILWINGNPENLDVAEHADFWKTTGQKPLLKWTDQSGSPHYLLHAVSRSILVGDCDLAVIVQNERSAGSAALLASPKAVGRYNLLPRVRILDRWELGCAGEGLSGLAGQVLDRIEKNKRDPSGVQLISLQPQPGVDRDAFSKGFPNAHILSDDSSGGTNILFRLNDLVNQLEEKGLDNGLLISWAGDELAVVSWVERV